MRKPPTPLPVSRAWTTPPSPLEARRSGRGLASVLLRLSRGLPVPLLLTSVVCTVPLILGQDSCPGTDADLDGYNSLVDCDDQNDDVFPGAPEQCNEIDDDCDGTIDEAGGLTWYTDQDGDGFGDPSSGASTCTPVVGQVLSAGDCSDIDATFHPGAVELCDGFDHDCDGLTGDVSVMAYYPDADRDGFGSSTGADCRPRTGYLRVRGDCNDNDSAIHPGAPDKPGDSKDSDCGGTDAQEPSVGYPSSPYTRIQDALDAAQNYTSVWIGPGTYLEQDLRLSGKQVVLIGSHFAPYTVIDAQSQGRILEITSVPYQTRIDGLTFTGGKASDGSALHIVAADPHIQSCILRSNLETAVYVTQANPLFMDSAVVGTQGTGFQLTNGSATVVRLNVSWNQGDGLDALDSGLDINQAHLEGNAFTGLNLTRVGFWIESSQFLRNAVGVSLSVTGGELHDCRISDNAQVGLVVRESSPALYDSELSENKGLGLQVSSAAFPSLRRCAIRANQGGGIRVQYDADQELQAFPSLIDSEISSNLAEHGGGIALESLTGISLTRCQLINNKALSGAGGGLDADRAEVRLQNVEVRGNVAPRGGGLSVQDGLLALSQTVVVANQATESGGGVQAQGLGADSTIEYAILAYNTGGNLMGTSLSLTIQYTDIYNPPGYVNSCPTGLGGTVLEVEPGFLSYDSGLPTSLHLAETSPLVDMGPTDPTAGLDADGSPRDFGIYGGADGATWDRDGDGFFDWFWPGPFEAYPDAVSPSGYDRADSDPAQH